MMGLLNNRRAQESGQKRCQELKAFMGFMAQDHGLTRDRERICHSCLYPLFLHFLRHVSFHLISLFHNHHVVFHKQHLRCQ